MPFQVQREPGGVIVASPLNVPPISLRPALQSSLKISSRALSNALFVELPEKKNPCHVPLTERVIRLPLLPRAETVPLIVFPSGPSVSCVEMVEFGR